MAGKVDGVALASIGAGAVFVYAGLKGYSVLAAIKSVVSGKAPSAGQSSSSLFNVTSSAAAGSVSGIASSSYTGGNQGSATNQRLGKFMAASYGWDSGAEWNALVKLWDQESGWSNTAQNPSSGAYGIPQALPYSKMPQSAWPPADGGHSDPVAQIGWGLAYIKERYGDPVNAWAHEQSNGWY